MEHESEQVVRTRKRTAGEFLRSAVRGLGGVRSWPAWVFALLLSVTQIVGSHIMFVGNPEALSLGRNYLEPWSWTDLIVLGVSVPICATLLMLVVELADAGALGPNLSRHEEGALRSPLKFVGVRVMLLLLAWIPYMLGYFPGGVAEDSLVALGQGPGTWDAAYPLGFTFLAKSFLALGVAVGTPDLGIFASTVTHSVAMAALLSYGVLLLARRGAPRVWCWVVVAYFALAPAFPIFAITMLKDVPFSLVIVALTYFMLAVVESDGALLRHARGIWALLILTVLCVAFRSNGIYVIAFTLAALVGAYRRDAFRAAVAVSLLLVVVVALSGPAFRAFDVKNDRAASEALGVPLQGVASVIACGAEIPPHQKAVLDRVLPLGMWRELYCSGDVLPIKSSEAFDKDYFNDHAFEFLATWAWIAVRHPGTVLESYALETFGYWKIGHDHPYLGPYLAPNDELGLYQGDMVAAMTGYWVSPTLTWIWARTPGRGGGFPAEGIFTWVMLASLAVVALQRRWVLALILAPCLAVWLTIMIAAPVAYGLRFLLPLAMCAPGFMLLPFYRPGLADRSGVQARSPR